MIPLVNLEQNTVAQVPVQDQTRCDFKCVVKNPFHYVSSFCERSVVYSEIVYSPMK